MENMTIGIEHFLHTGEEVDAESFAAVKKKYPAPERQDG